MAFTGLNYNAPTSPFAGTNSSVDGTGSGQMSTFFWLKKAIITARKDQYFGSLATTTNMPKNFGKTIKVYEYVPLLDSRNVNSQGIDASGVTSSNGNLYGSSRDIGVIAGRIPTLTEAGGRVNRIGFTRLEREGSIHKFGVFYEFTQESVDFDSDNELMDHLATELMNGAVQLTEAMLQMDLLAAAGTILYAGAATTDGTVTAEGAGAAIVSYKNLMRLDQILTDNRTPKQTTVINGSRLVDTLTLPSARVMFIGNEVLPLLKGMTDLFGTRAFIAIQHYADAGTVLNGEVGTIDAFRLVLVPEMLHWTGTGATVGTNPGYRHTVANSVDKYDVYPMLVVGDDSFTTIGFQTDGKSVKFNAMTKMPGVATADRNDPYGETGFSSLKWYYGMLVKRPERIALIKTVAPI